MVWNITQTRVREEVEQERRSKKGTRYDNSETNDLVDVSISQRNRLLEAEKHDNVVMISRCRMFVHAVLAAAQEFYPSAEIADFRYDEDCWQWELEVNLGQPPNEQHSALEVKVANIMIELEVPEGFIDVIYTDESADSNPSNE